MEVQDFGCMVSVDKDMIDRGDYGHYIGQMIDNAKKDLLFKAHSQAEEGGWLCTRITTRKEFNPRSMRYDFTIKADCMAVENQPVRIYVPVESSEFSLGRAPMPRMPKDVFFCAHCHGYTKNDMRGHCLACGAPRGKESYE